jgi:hypothetical protein
MADNSVSTEHVQAIVAVGIFATGAAAAGIRILWRRWVRRRGEFLQRLIGEAEGKVEARVALAEKGIDSRIDEVERTMAANAETLLAKLNHDRDDIRDRMDDCAAKLRGALDTKADKASTQALFDRIFELQERHRDQMVTAITEWARGACQKSE